VRAEPDRLTAFTAVAPAASPATPTLSLVLIPGPPVLTFSVASVVFLLALLPRR